MAHSDRVFRLEEKFERDGSLRLMLIGELDVAVIDHLSTRLRELRKGGYRVRLDLSRASVHRLERNPGDHPRGRRRRRDGWELEVDGPMTEQVARTVDLVGARAFLWPDEG